MSTLGKWITNETTAPFYARKKFAVEKEIRKGEAKVCGLGQFNFYINGQKVEDHELDPGWTDYKKLIQYVTFDVTSYLKFGENVLGAEVGNGWFIKSDEHYTFKFPEFMPQNPNPYEPFGKFLVLALELTLIYSDGREEIISADDTFAVKVHPTVMSNVYGSETMDGRLVQRGWYQEDFDDSDWQQATIVSERDTPKGVLENQCQPAIRVIHTYEGKRIHQVEGREIYDFGQNMSGILEFEVKGHAGDIVKWYPAEKLAESGDVDQVAKNWVNVDSCITYIIGQDDIWETFRMKFTYFAGRYMALEKISAVQEMSAIKLRSIKAHAISSAHETDGTFTCDDERYNKIYDMIEKAVEANIGL